MRILVFGDSITQGFCDMSGGGWCNRLIKECFEREVVSDYQYNRTIFNLGVSGDNTSDLLKRVRAESEARILKYPPEDFDVAILAIGVNDSQYEMGTGQNRVSVAEMNKNLESIYQSISDLFKKIIIVGIAPVFDKRVQPMTWKTTHGYSNKEISRYNAVLQKFAIAHGQLFFNIQDVYQGKESVCLPDGIHPNELGHEYMYLKIKSMLEENKIL